MFLILTEVVCHMKNKKNIFNMLVKERVLEVLKNQSRSKSDLSEIKIGGKKSRNQKNTTKNIKC